MMGWLRELLFLPPAATQSAREIDALHFVVIGISFFGSMTVMIALVTFLLRYRKTKERSSAPQLSAPRWLEFSIAGSMLTLFLVFWFAGYQQYLDLRKAPQRAQTVYGTAKQWMWKFSYPDGRITVGYLVVPQAQPTKLVLSSRDVIHSFYVPAFRIKQDILPSRFTSMWFEPDQPGTYAAMCAEYCGDSHSRMWADVVVLPADEYAAWKAGALPKAVKHAQAGAKASRQTPLQRYGKARPGLVEHGRETAERFGCLACHSVDGTPRKGPTWAGAFGTMRLQQDGSSLLVDEEYLSEAMQKPQAKRPHGFDSHMPSYQGVLRPYDVAALVGYIKSLRDSGLRDSEARDE